MSEPETPASADMKPADRGPFVPSQSLIDALAKMPLEKQCSALMRVEDQVFRAKELVDLPGFVGTQREEIKQRYVEIIGEFSFRLDKLTPEQKEAIVQGRFDSMLNPLPDARPLNPAEYMAICKK